MTAVPDPTLPTGRKSVHMPVWAVVTLGVAVVFVAAFVLGHWVGHHGRHFEAERRLASGPSGGFVEGHRAHPFLGLLLVVAVVAVVGLLVYAAIRHFSASPNTPAGPATDSVSSAELLLDQRLARGEI